MLPPSLQSMVKTTPEMNAATGDRLTDAPTMADACEDVARHLPVPAVAVHESLAMARSLDANSDSAFGTKFCDVDDVDALNYDDAAAYLANRFHNLTDAQAFALAGALAVEGMYGMMVERHIVAHYGFLSPAPRSEESNGHDAQSDDAWISVKRNDRTKVRHGARKGWGDEETILLSWGVVDGAVVVAFEDETRETMGHKVVSA